MCDFFIQADAWQGSIISSPTPIQNLSQDDPWLPPSSAPIPPKPDPWQPKTVTPGPIASPPTVRSDPWSPTSPHSSTDLDEFDVITNRNRSSPKTNGVSSNNNTPDPFEFNLLGESLPNSGPSPSTGATKKTPHSFLGDNAALVNLDNLVMASK